MEAFTPLINLLVLLSVLSVAAERATNVLKLRRPQLRDQQDDPKAEKERELAITQTSLLVSIIVALIVKANLFEILTHLEAPWETLGWVTLEGSQWVRSMAAASASSILYSLGGSALTGIAMGFGSKFWHDMLDVVFNAQENLKRRRAPDSSSAGG